MFALLINGQIDLGPRDWNKRVFETHLDEECNIVATLPASKVDEEPIVINANTKIVRVRYLPIAEHNKKIQTIAGPYYTIYDTYIDAHFDIIDKSLEKVKLELKHVVATNRYKKEIAGIKHAVQNQEVTLITQRGERDIYLQAKLAMTTNVDWKFNEGWITVTSTEMDDIVTAIKNHVQACFTDEKNKDAEIDAALTLADLDAIVLEV